MLLPIGPGAFDAWSASFVPVLGRFACIAVADGGAGLSGFVAGRIRTLPPFFGGGLAGFVSDVYVDASARGQGLARALLDAAGDWFRSQGVRRMELQVIMGNGAARDAYLRLGWKEELIQMVLELPDPRVSEGGGR
jgi:GNAT superfamily N-acetyltransferase